jgi:hypothetical protein
MKKARNGIGCSNLEILFSTSISQVAACIFFIR